MAQYEFALLPENHASNGIDPIVGPTLLLVGSPGPENESERYRALAKRAGFKVVTAHSLPMALVVCLRVRPDLILLSPVTGSPGASELARRIKEDPKTADIPVMTLVDTDPTDPDLSHVYPTEACAADTASDEELVQTMRALRATRPSVRAGRAAPAPAPAPEFEFEFESGSGPGSGSGPSCSLEGDLADDTLPGVLELLFTTRRTGRIVVVSGSKNSGSIYVDDGHVVHAELARQRGASAFNEMCFLKRGRFKFEPEFRPARRTMHDNGMEILLDGARHHDESARTTG